ncbi:MAG: hypothetical protein AAF797_01300 [Planctomycetota bacterium]
MKDTNALACLVALTLAWTGGPAAADLLIDFETPPYANGELNGQVDFTGSGADGNWVVSGGAAQITNGPSAGNNRVTAVFDPADFGVASLSDLTASDTLVRLAFDITLPQLDTGPNNLLVNFELRGDSTAETFPEQIATIQIRNDGRIRINGTNFNNQIDDTDPYNVALLLDFGDQTLDVFFDGSTTAAASFGFIDTDVIGYDQLRMTRQGQAIGASQVLRVDNINSSIVPEPASLSLAALGALCLLPRRRR